MRACINCDNREQWNAGSRCKVDGHYIGYVQTWDETCEKWHLMHFFHKPGQIDIYAEPPREMSEDE